MKNKPIYCTPQQLGKYVDGINVDHLANLRSQKRGPKFYKRDRRVYYRIDDVLLWVSENPVLTIDQKE